MKSFLDSGGLFVVVALISVFAGIVSEDGSVFIALGGFWIVVAIIVRARRAKKPSDDPDL